MASYYDVDAILTDAQKVPCTFELDIPGLGYLEGNPGQDVCKPFIPNLILANNAQDKSRYKGRASIMAWLNPRYKCTTRVI